MHSHERIDPRRGPGRERDDGRREIDAGVAEYEEDRDAKRASLYDSSDDWGFIDCDDDWLDDEMDHPEDYPMADPTADAHEPDDDDARISARVEDDKIVIEVPVPASMPDEGLERERQAMNVYDMVRSVFFPNSHAEAMKLALEILEGAAKLPTEPDSPEDMMQGKITLLKEVWRRPANALAGGGKVNGEDTKTTTPV